MQRVTADAGFGWIRASRVTHYLSIALDLKEIAHGPRFALAAGMLSSRTTKKAFLLGSLLAGLSACSADPSGNSGAPGGANGSNGADDSDGGEISSVLPGLGGSADGGRAADGAAPGTGPTFHADIHETSVSGLSSGAFMAVQFHVAFSSIMKGAAIFAGGPFDCAQGSMSNALTRCMSPTSTVDATPFVTETQAWAMAGTIDPVSNLTAQKIFLFGGASDNTVAPAVMDSLNSYYAALVGAGNIVYESRHAGAAHTMPTTSYGGACGTTAEPWIGNCSYDGAGKALAQIYGTLNAPTSAATGAIVPIDQTTYITNPKSHSLADTGYVYVPTACSSGEACRIHVAFHGCEQEATGSVGDKFYRNAGYNPWADTNHIIVLYPQTIVSNASPSNGNACWDWWGYDSADYAKKSGPQMAMVKAMIDHLASTTVTGGGPTTTDGGAASSSDAGGSGACVTATNYAHVQAGRAHDQAGHALADGSNQDMGLDNVAVETSLKSVGPDDFVIGTCP